MSKSNSFKIKQMVIPLFISLFFLTGTLYVLFDLPYFNQLSLDILFIGVLSYIFSVVSLLFAMKINRKQITQLMLNLKGDYKKIINKGLIIILVFALIYLYRSSSVLYLVLVESVNREYLVFEYGGIDRFIYIANPIFFSLFPVSVILNYSKKIIILLLIGAISAVIFQLSRSSLLQMLLFSIILISLEGFNTKKIILFGITTVVTVLAAIYITVEFQGRASNFLGGLNRMIYNLFRYRAWSFFLSERVISISSFEKVLYPFFGFFSERLLSINFDLSNPVSVLGSHFVGGFYNFADGVSANVLYPWWAWFYGAFGAFGVLIQSIYIFVLGNIIFKFRLSLLSIYYIYIILFMAPIRHPILTNDNLYFILIVLFIDLIVKYGSRIKVSL